jgi:hypothetical protein
MDKHVNASNSTNRLFCTISGGLIASLVCGYTTCNIRSLCINSNTCVDVSVGFCSFNNKVNIPKQPFDIFNMTSNLFAREPNSVCSPGYKMNIIGKTQKSECVPFFPFPNAINYEIMNPNASSPVEKACGKWIEAGGAVDSVYGRGSFDNNNWIEELEHVEDIVTSYPRLDHNDMSKFRSECERTVFDGPFALQKSASKVFDYFEDYIETIVVNRTGFLKACGFIAGHYCDSPVATGYFLDSSYVVLLYNGHLFGATTLSDSLKLFDTQYSVQQEANHANSEIRELFLGGNSSDLTSFERYQLMVGASGMSNINYKEAVARTTLGGAALKYYDKNPQKAISYLKGISAFCAFEALYQFVDYDSSREQLYSNLKKEVRHIRDSRPAATSLGRLKQVGDLDQANPYSDVLKVSGITLASIAGNKSSGIPSTDCLEMLRKVFADSVESARFTKIIPSQLYSNLQYLTSTVKDGIGLAFETDPLKNTISSKPEFEKILSGAKLRIVGAPVGSWAGENRNASLVEFTSNDGMFLMIIKKSRSLYTHSFIQTVSDSSISLCDHDVLWSELTWNAYAMRTYNTYCAVIFLGLAHKPLMDPLYDDESLLSRSLFVVAHEFAHFSQLSGLVSKESWNKNGLLEEYYKDTHSEAYADVVAAVAILSTGMVKREKFDIHHCQVWCSRQPLWYQQPLNTIHPIGNDRCSFLIKTLDKFYPTLGR